MQNITVPLLIWLVLGSLLSLLLLWGGVMSLINQVSFSKNASSTEGRVVDLIVERERNSGVVYHLVVQFPAVETGSGEKVIFDLNSRPPSYLVGDLVPILYDPTNPLQARINSWRDRWFPAMFSIVIVGNNFLLLFLWCN